MMHASTPKRLQAVENPVAMLGVVGQVGYMIAVPAFVFGFAGAYVDKWLQTSPLFTIGGLVVALVASSVAVYRLTKRILSSSL